jgi:hypothetical protein
MHKKVMEKVATKVIRKTHCKEKEENRVKKYVIYYTIDEQASQHVAIRSARAIFEYNWSIIVVNEAKQHLHEHVRASWATQEP